LIFQEIFEAKNSFGRLFEITKKKFPKLIENKSYTQTSKKEIIRFEQKDSMEDNFRRKAMKTEEDNSPIIQQALLKRNHKYLIK